MVISKIRELFVLDLSLYFTLTWTIYLGGIFAYPNCSWRHFCFGRLILSTAMAEYVIKQYGFSSYFYPLNQELRLFVRFQSTEDTRIEAGLTRQQLHTWYSHCTWTGWSYGRRYCSYRINRRFLVIISVWRTIIKPSIWKVLKISRVHW